MAHKIEFEFQPGDKAFFMHENRVIESEVKHVGVNISASEAIVKYSLKDCYPHNTRTSDLVFASKEALLKSL